MPNGTLASPQVDWVRRPSAESSGLTTTRAASSPHLQVPTTRGSQLLTAKPMPPRAACHDTPLTNQWGFFVSRRVGETAARTS